MNTFKPYCVIVFFKTNKDKMPIKQRQEDKKFSVSDHIFNVEANKYGIFYLVENWFTILVYT